MDFLLGNNYGVFGQSTEPKWGEGEIAEHVNATENVHVEERYIVCVCVRACGRVCVCVCIVTPRSNDYNHVLSCDHIQCTSTISVSN